MSKQGKVRALAATLRLPNVPSVWSNTLTGVVFACLIHEDEGFLSFLALPLLIATCLYFAGNLLNDWADQKWDEKHRPERALPSGVYHPKTYLCLAISLIAVALVTAFLLNPWAIYVSLFLTGSILIYTWSHKRSAWGVVPMALCRASLPLLGFCSTVNPHAFCSCSHNHSMWILLPAAMLFSYLIMLSLRARAESKPSNSAIMPLLTGMGFLLPIILLIATPHAPINFADGIKAITLAALPYTVWTLLALSAFRRPIPRQISALLAGIPLIDALFLMPYLLLGHVLMEHPLSFWLVMAWAPAFILGRLLQRYVPAT